MTALRVADFYGPDSLSIPNAGRVGEVVGIDAPADGRGWMVWLQFDDEGGASSYSAERLEVVRPTGEILVELSGIDKDLGLTLAHGWAHFRHPRPLLHYWEQLANRGPAVPAPNRLTAYSVIGWARQVLAAADRHEPGMAPSARVSVCEDATAGTVIRLSWNGTWTRDRWVTVEMVFQDDYMHSRLEWCSGTGERSRFLGIERLLVSEACDDFGAMDEAHCP